MDSTHGQQPNHVAPLPSNDAKQLAAFREQRRDVALPEPLKRWANGIPSDEIELARDEWESSREALSSNAPMGANVEFFYRTIQLVNASNASARVTLLEAAIGAQPDSSLSAVHQGQLVRDALRDGDANRARSFIAEMATNAQDGLTDSAFRLARAALALEERDAKGALTCLGHRDDEIPIAPMLRGLAILLRGQALALVGDADASQAELELLLEKVGAASASRMVSNLPAHWNVDRAFLLIPSRLAAQSRAKWKLIGALLTAALAAVCLAPLVAHKGPFSGDTFTLAVGVAVLVVTAALLLNQWRAEKTIANHGRIAVGRVSGSSPAFFASRKGRKPRYLQVEVEHHGEAVYARSLRTFSRDKALALVGKEVHVLWHPRYRDRAMVELV